MTAMMLTFCCSTPEIAESKSNPEIAESKSNWIAGTNVLSKSGLGLDMEELPLGQLAAAEESTDDCAESEATCAF